MLMKASMNNEEKPVIFHEEGTAKISQRYLVPLKPETETHDRIVKLLMKISGGNIKSAKTARYIIFILIAIMIVLSMYWFFA